MFIGAANWNNSTEIRRNPTNIIKSTFRFEFCKMYQLQLYKAYTRLITWRLWPLVIYGDIVSGQ